MMWQIVSGAYAVAERRTPFIGLPIDALDAAERCHRLVPQLLVTNMV